MVDWERSGKTKKWNVAQHRNYESLTVNRSVELELVDKFRYNFGGFVEWDFGTKQMKAGNPIEYDLGIGKA